MSRTVPLFLQLSAADPRPLTRQISDAVRRAIASGELAEGDQLPSVRGLAQQLAVNPNTVAKAYSELSGEGWLVARQGLGLFAAAPPQRLSKAERERRLGLAVEAFSADVVGLGFPLATVLDRVNKALAPCLDVRRA